MRSGVRGGPGAPGLGGRNAAPGYTGSSAPLATETHRRFCHAPNLPERPLKKATRPLPPAVPEPREAAVAAPHRLGPRDLEPAATPAKRKIPSARRGYKTHSHGRRVAAGTAMRCNPRATAPPGGRGPGRRSGGRTRVVTSPRPLCK